MGGARASSVALDAQLVPAYAAAGVNRAATIGAYAGAAVYEADGGLFGAICGLDPVRRLDDVARPAAAPLLGRPFRRGPVHRRRRGGDPGFG